MILRTNIKVPVFPPLPSFGKGCNYSLLFTEVMLDFFFFFTNMKFFYLTVVGYPAAPRMNDTKGHQLYVIVLCQASDKLSSGFGKNTWGRLAIGKCE